MAKVAGTALYLAGIFLVTFNNYMSRQFPDSEDTDKGKTQSSPDSKYGWSHSTYKHLKYAYITLASSGIMTLFGTAIIAYKLSILGKEDPTLLHAGKRMAKCVPFCYISGFLGVVLNLVSVSLGIMMIHNDETYSFLCFLVPFGGIFVIVMVLFCVIEK